MLLAGMPFAFAEDAPSGPPLTGDHIPTSQGDLIIHPMKHATLALGWNGHTIMIDPVEGPQMRYEDMPAPDLILITAVGDDHLDVKQLQSLVQKKTRIVAPVDVENQLPDDLKSKTTVLARGESTAAFDIMIDSVSGGSAGNAPQGNGYVLTLGGKRLYVSGDLEDPSVLQSLKNIDVAFVDFDMPPATTPEKVADAVKQMHPSFVYPYNYRRGDPVAFKGLIGWESDIKVRIRAWY
jgi:L-ascorbate metabolism protein UlaG (beta-lactamase superfamily)